MSENQEKEFLTETERNTAITQIMQICDEMQFFSVILKRDDVNKEDIKLYMELYEAYFRDLSKTLHYGSILVEEYGKRYKEIRELHAENQRLEDLLGKEITPEGVTGALRKYDNIFTAWYESIGFHYASAKFLNWGIVYAFSEELDYDRDATLSSAKELFALMAEKNKAITDSPEWDVHRDRYHAELLDTDRNRENIKNLFSTTFPDSQIRSFISRKNDFGSFSLRFEVQVPFRDIENMRQKYCK